MTGRGAIAAILLALPVAADEQPEDGRTLEDWQALICAGGVETVFFDPGFDARHAAGGAGILPRDLAARLDDPGLWAGGWIDGWPRSTTHGLDEIAADARGTSTSPAPDASPETAPVPLPPAGLLLAALIGGLALLQRRRAR